MDIDFVVNNGKHMTGVLCYSSNLKNALLKKIRLKELKEIDTSKNIPKIIMAFKFFFPFDIKTTMSINPVYMPIRKNSIVHLTSQYFAWILLSQKCKSIVTVHDLLLFEFSRKELFTGKKFSYFNKLMLKINLMALKKANRIIADSEYTKKRIIKIMGYDPNMISVVYLGVDKKKFKPLKVKRNPSTILYVGSETPGKNLPALIKAFAKLKKQIPDAKLIKIGLPQWPNSRKKNKDLVHNLDLTDSVSFKDYCKNLRLEYSKATLLVQPSIYEGFGLPVLEAMACGCPVICSNRTSLPEVGGDAALYFDGYDIDNLTKKMYKVLTDKKLHQNMVKKGFEQAKKFTWEKTAEETIEVYKKL